jgi:serine/threonine-protein kinase
MSPEQILCKKLDARADLWGVAACVYRMVCGRSPFGQGGIAELGLRILATEAFPPSTLVPDLPPAFDAWMTKALAKGAEDRFQSARDLGDALAAAAAIDAQATVPEGMQTPLPDLLPVAVLEPSISIEVAASRETSTRETFDLSTRGERTSPVARIARAESRRARARVALTIAGCALALFSAGVMVAKPKATPAVAAPDFASTVVPTQAAPTQAAPTQAAVTYAVPAPCVAPSASEPVPVPAPTPSVKPAAPKAKPSKALASEAQHLWIKKDEL